ncbi:MAG: protease modulator HflK, partial [Azonexus sp.]|nr:protease modulator HflK [Azonexus sp.]
QKNEGQAYANDVVPRARGTAARLQEEAQGYKQRVIANAEGDASRFRQIQAEYAKAPEVTRQRMYLDTMQQIYSNTTKIMVDAKGQGNLLYLPLDKLMQATAAATPPRSAAEVVAPAATGNRPAFSGEVPPQTEGSPNFSSREGRSSLSSRERETR